MKEGSWNGGLHEGDLEGGFLYPGPWKIFYEGDLEGGFLYWGPWKIFKERHRIQASLFIVAPLRPRGTWNQEGARVPGTGNAE